MIEVSVNIWSNGNTSWYRYSSDPCKFICFCFVFFVCCWFFLFVFCVCFFLFVSIQCQLRLVHFILKCFVSGLVSKLLIRLEVLRFANRDMTAVCTDTRMLHRCLYLRSVSLLETSRHISPKPFLYIVKKRKKKWSELLREESKFYFTDKPGQFMNRGI